MSSLRRSGARLRSLGRSHGELQMTIAQLKEVRTTYKSFVTAQTAAVQDLMKWALKDENRAIQDVISQIGDLWMLWTDLQKDFAEHMKDFRHHFEMILEGEKGVDGARNNLDVAEAKEAKYRKELKKLRKKSSGGDGESHEALEAKVRMAEKERDSSQVEVMDRVKEHEAVKMIRIKEGLVKFTSASSELVQKGQVILDAQNKIAQQLPAIRDQDIHDIRYTGAQATLQIVLDTKDAIRQQRGHSPRPAPMSPCAPPTHPPGYAETPPPENPFYGAAPPSYAPPSSNVTPTYGRSNATPPHHRLPLSPSNGQLYPSLHGQGQNGLHMRTRHSESDIINGFDLNKR